MGHLGRQVYGVPSWHDQHQRSGEYQRWYGPLLYTLLICFWVAGADAFFAVESAGGNTDHLKKKGTVVLQPQPDDSVLDPLNW